VGDSSNWHDSWYEIISQSVNKNVNLIYIAPLTRTGICILPAITYWQYRVSLATVTAVGSVGLFQLPNGLVLPLGVQTCFPHLLKTYVFTRY